MSGQPTQMPLVLQHPAFCSNRLQPYATFWSSLTVAMQKQGQLLNGTCLMIFLHFQSLQSTGHAPPDVCYSHLSQIWYGFAIMLREVRRRLLLNLRFTGRLPRLAQVPVEEKDMRYIRIRPVQVNKTTVSRHLPGKPRMATRQRQLSLQWQGLL